MMKLVNWEKRNNLANVTESVLGIEEGMKIHAAWMKLYTLNPSAWYTYQYT